MIKRRPPEVRLLHHTQTRLLTPGKTARTKGTLVKARDLRNLDSSLTLFRESIPMAIRLSLNRRHRYHNQREGSEDEGVKRD